MKNRIVVFDLLIVMISVLLAGCCTRVPVFPVGAYVAHEMDQDFVLDFEKDGSYSAALAGGALIMESSYRPAGDSITFAADPPCVDEATYKWALEGETLTFEVRGEDLCRARRESLQDTTYTCITCT